MTKSIITKLLLLVLIIVTLYLLFDIYNNNTPDFENYNSTNSLNYSIQEYVEKAKYLSIEEENFLGAIEIYKKISNIEPNNPEYLIEMGWIYQYYGDYDKAKELFLKSIQLINQTNYTKKVYHGPYFGMTVTYIHENKTDLLPNMILKALDYERDDDEFYRFLGSEYLLKKNYHNAEEMFNLSLQVNPRYVQAYNMLSATYYLQGKYETAKKYSDISYSIDPNHYYTNHRIGLVYFQLGKLDQARKYLERYYELRKVPDLDSNGDFVLARIYYTKGKLNDSKKILNEIVKYYNESFYNFKDRTDIYYIEKLHYEDAKKLLVIINNQSNKTIS